MLQESQHRVVVRGIELGSGRPRGNSHVAETTVAFGKPRKDNQRAACVLVEPLAKGRGGSRAAYMVLEWNQHLLWIMTGYYNHMNWLYHIG